MHIAAYLEERAGTLILQLFLMLVSGSYLIAAGNRAALVGWILTIWCLILIVFLCLDYTRKRRRLNHLQSLFDQLEEKYLFTEIAGKPDNIMEEFYFSLNRRAEKAMLDNIEQISHGSREYKEYIESWIHEVKSPITAIELLLENSSLHNAGDIRMELDRIEELVNQTLYYARSGSVEKDYFIQGFPLIDAVGTALNEHRTALLKKQIQLQVDDLLDMVYTDPKWTSYIISLLISNAIKYTNASGCIQLFSHQEEKGIWLCIRDNGCGISAADLPRVCERGFTGSNRQKNGATGMGLYLADELCRKLGLTFSISSDVTQGTIVKIGFPAGTFVRS